MSSVHLCAGKKGRHLRWSWRYMVERAEPQRRILRLRLDLCLLAPSCRSTTRVLQYTKSPATCRVRMRGSSVAPLACAHMTTPPPHPSGGASLGGQPTVLPSLSGLVPRHARTLLPDTPCMVRPCATRSVAMGSYCAGAGQLAGHSRPYFPSPCARCSRPRRLRASAAISRQRRGSARMRHNRGGEATLILEQAVQLPRQPGLER